MFRILGNCVVRYWPFILVGWLVLLVTVLVTAPPWSDVIEDGEFAFLPEDSPSRLGEKLFQESWNDSQASRVVIVVQRESNDVGLMEEDKVFIEETLKPALEEIAREEGIYPAAVEGAETGDGAAEHTVEVPVRTYKDGLIGRLLESTDNKASIVIVELPYEFLDARNAPIIARIEKLIAQDGELSREGKLPPGLALATSGEATVGRDMMRAARESSDATEKWTVLLVVTLLIVIYRAPVLALIPLLTVAISTEISLHVLALLGQFGVVKLFNGIEVYVTVLSYGAGVDYCLFLIARYKEELDGGAGFDDGVGLALQKVGAALTASACTVMCGIGMMVFAEFGKFQQAGVGITLGLLFVLLAALTFTPALLQLTGRWAFWPRIPGERLAGTSGWITPSNLMARILEQNLIQVGWRKMGQLLLRRPGTVWLVSVLIMLPFACVGIIFYEFLSYGLLSELPQDNASVIGAKAVQKHFPAGTAGPVIVLLKNSEIDFTSQAGVEIVGEISDTLNQHREELGLADIRSVANPLGVSPAATAGLPQGRFARMTAIRLMHQRAMPQYVSTQGEAKNHVTRMDLIFHDDPFSRDSIAQFETLRETFEDALPERVRYPQIDQLGIALVEDANQQVRVADVREGSPAAQAGLYVGDVITRIHDVTVDSPMTLREGLHAALDEQSTQIAVQRTLAGEKDATDLILELPPANGWRTRVTTEIYPIGPTASIRDLKDVTDRDQIKIDILVLAGVFLILVVLLRQPAISLYLIITVFFSYLVTLGVTFAVFWFLDTNPEGFAGLDWKVPMFLFTILIAVGEDYNIFLMTRIEEEQRKHGMIQGVVVALERTGSIISSCGVIMAGTFCSLLAGSLVGMHQLGFALAFGVLLDTFVVRPILVPAYLILLFSGRMGVFGKFLGAHGVEEAPITVPVRAGSDG